MKTQPLNLFTLGAIACLLAGTPTLTRSVSEGDASATLTRSVSEGDASATLTRSVSEGDASADDQPVRLPDEYAEVVLTVEGMT